MSEEKVKRLEEWASARYSIYLLYLLYWYKSIKTDANASRSVRALGTCFN